MLKYVTVPIDPVPVIDSPSSLQAFWWPDISLLCIVFGVFIIASFLALQLFVKERR